MKRILFLVLAFLLVGVQVFAQGGRQTVDIMNDVWNEEQTSLKVGIVSGDNIDVQITPGSSLVAFVSTDVSSVVACQLSEDSTAVMLVIISPLPTNLNQIWVGGSTAVTQDVGFCLSADIVEPLRLPVDDVQDIYFSAEKGGEGVSWIAITR